MMRRFLLLLLSFVKMRIAGRDFEFWVWFYTYRDLLDKFETFVFSFGTAPLLVERVRIHPPLGWQP